MSDFKGFPGRPNLQGYTAVPNAFFDEVMANINNMSELKVLLAVFRKTYGWVKEIDSNGQPVYKLEDSISYSQFEELTGLSSTSVANGITRNIESGYLEKVKQGNYSGTSNSYRIVTETKGKKKEKPPKVEAPKTPEEPKQNTPHPIQRFQMDDNIVVNPKGQYGTSMTDILSGNSSGGDSGVEMSSEKKDILADIFGEVKDEAPKKKEEKQSTPNQRFIGTWLGKYQEIIGIPYGNLSGKDHGQVKMLLGEYDIDTLLNAIDFYFRNYQNIESLPADYPTLAIFCGWRKTLIPQSKLGVIPKKAKKNEREFTESKWEGDDFFDS